MSEENNIIVLTDENGNEVEFEVVADFEFDGEEYAVLLELGADSDDALLFKVVEEADGQSTLEYVVDDEEFERVAAEYEALMSQMN